MTESLVDETHFDPAEVPQDTTSSQNTRIEHTQSLDSPVRNDQESTQQLGTRPRRTAADRACAVILQSAELTRGPSPRGLSTSTKTVEDKRWDRQAIAEAKHNKTHARKRLKSRHDHPKSEVNEDVIILNGI